MSEERHIDNWSTSHPEDRKQVEYKKINGIVIGYARDKRTNQVFYCVTDLGEDISVLFDYEMKKMV